MHRGLTLPFLCLTLHFTPAQNDSPKLSHLHLSLSYASCNCKSQVRKNAPWPYFSFPYLSLPLTSAQNYSPCLYHHLSLIRNVTVKILVIISKKLYFLVYFSCLYKSLFIFQSLYSKRYISYHFFFFFLFFVLLLLVIFFLLHILRRFLVIILKMLRFFIFSSSCMSLFISQSLYSVRYISYYFFPSV